MQRNEPASGPDRLIKDHLHILKTLPQGRPIIDIACGYGHNGIYLASLGYPVILVDRSWEALQKAGENAAQQGTAVTIFQVDLEQNGLNPFENLSFGAAVVFRYLHRPLFPCIRKAMEPGGILIYETFTTKQAQYGKPRSEAHLLKPGELREWFGDWEILHFFEGTADHPRREISQIICRKAKKE